MEVWLGKTRVRLDPSRSIGKGGEADVFGIGGDRALKLFKSPGHPDYRGLPHEQKAAEERLAIHQEKLRRFPSGLPAEVVAPEQLATDKAGSQILGYAMRLVAPAEPILRLADPAFRRSGFPGAEVVAVFQHLHRALEALHRAGVVVGDFNDRNLLLRGSEPFLIDADSFQFAGFPCGVFTERFVDPLLCDPGAQGPELVRPHGDGSDWYAFAVLLMQSLLFVGPYGGLYKPKDPARRIPQSLRPFSRITVFHPEVQYPKPAASPGTLPDELLQHFHRVFERDERGPFPRALLDGLRFEECPSCGVEHARSACPTCRPHAVAQTAVALRIRGEVTCRRLFETRGQVLCASTGDGRLRWLAWEGGALRREDGAVVLRGRPDPRLKLGFQGETTLLGLGAELTAVRGDRRERFAVDTDGRQSAFDTDGRRRFWVQGGRLWRDADPRLGALGDPEPIGEVLAGQTRIWAGPAFGLGLYRAGALTVGFLFDAARRGLDDSLRLPPLPGELLEADCQLDAGRAWLLLTMQEGGRTRHRCLVWSRSGALEASAEAEAGDGSWLGTLGGKVACGGQLFAATDAGLVRLEVRGGRIEQTREFPDTEPFVSSGCRLLAGAAGLVVVHPREIVSLQLK